MPEPKTEVIRGVLRRPRFHNQNNGFAILNVEIPDNILGEDFLSTITCKGILPSVRQNEEYQFTGQWVNDPKWGMQFQFTKAEVILPKTEDGAVRYLSTIAAGIGPKKAERIVNALGGTEAIDTILNEPEKLYKLEFVTQEQAQELVTALMENTPWPNYLR
jgi:exodeoxyribonuclease V alpha subunit